MVVCYVRREVDKIDERERDGLRMEMEDRVGGIGFQAGLRLPSSENREERERKFKGVN